MKRVADLKRFELPAHLAINKNSLIQVLEEQLDKIIDSQLNRQEEDLKLKLKRNGPLGLSVKEFELHFILPLHIDIQKQVLGGTISMQGGIIVHWISELKLLGNELFEFQSHISSFEWSKNPKLDLGAVAIPVKSIVDTILNRKAKLLSEQIDHSINSFISPNTHLQNFLTELHVGIKVGKEKRLSITGEMEQMKIAYFREDEHWIRSDITLSGLLLAYSSDLPDFRVEKVWPQIGIQDQFNQQFTLFGHALFSYTSLAQLVEAQLNAPNSPLLKNGIKTEHVIVSDEKEVLVLTMDLSGRINGRLTATFDAYFDKSKGDFHLTDLDIKLKSNSWLDRTSFAFVKDKIQHQLHEGISQLIGKQIPLIQSQILNVIRHQTEPFGLKVEVDGFLLRFNRIDFVNNHLEMELESTGVLQIKCPDLTILNAYFK